MYNRKSLAPWIILSIVLSVAPAFCQLEVTGSLVTNYVWRGFDVLSGGPAIQPSITYSVEETGFSANMWGSWAITKRQDGSIRNLDELDLTVAYTKNIGDYSLNAGYIYYGFPSMDGYPDELSTNSEANIGVSFDKIPFSPSVNAFLALNDKSWDGLYVSVGAGHSIPTSAANLNLSLSIGYTDQSLVTNLTDAGLSDMNLSLDTGFECCGLNWTPAFTLTYVPMKEVFSDYLIFWGALNVGR